MKEACVRVWSLRPQPSCFCLIYPPSGSPTKRREFSFNHFLLCICSILTWTDVTGSPFACVLIDNASGSLFSISLRRAHLSLRDCFVCLHSYCHLLAKSKKGCRHPHHSKCRKIACKDLHQKKKKFQNFHFSLSRSGPCSFPVSFCAPA